MLSACCYAAALLCLAPFALDEQTGQRPSPLLMLKQGGGGLEKKFLETAYKFFCGANPRRVGGVRKFFPYTYDQNFYQTKLFQSKNSAR